MRPVHTNTAALRWRISSYSASNGACVEVAALDEGSMAVRDSKDRGGPVLTFGVGEWRAFVSGVRAGQFDR
ncbi:MAG TPA: DUF397 domain-containing protein [Actinopolymorphaceae bacterium]